MLDGVQHDFPLTTFTSLYYILGFTFGKVMRNYCFKNNCVAVSYFPPNWYTVYGLKKMNIKHGNIREVKYEFCQQLTVALKLDFHLFILRKSLEFL